MNRSKKEMNRKNNNNSSKFKQDSHSTSEKMTKPKVQKPKVPASHCHFNGKNYPIESVGASINLYCKECRTDNARLIGYIKTEDLKVYYIVRCPWHHHDAQFLEENVFLQKYPDVLPRLSFSNNRNPNWPAQRSYCKNCRATTAEIIGEIETEYGSRWVVRCTECDAGWTEYKDIFYQKYIGTDKIPPLYRQTTPKPVFNWKDPKSLSSPMEKLKAVKISPMEVKKAKVLSSVTKNSAEEIHGKPIAGTDPLPSEKKEELNELDLQIQGITLKLPSGTNASVEIIDGKPVISIK